MMVPFAFELSPLSWTLGGLALAVTLWVVVWSRITGHPAVLFPLHLFHQFYARVVWRTRVVGVFPLPRGVGGLVIANHRSGIDPAFVELAAARPMHWMVAKEYFKGAAGFFMRQLGCVPVNRAGADTAAAKQSLRLIEQGGVVGLFPEGRINETQDLLLPGRPGAAFLALRANAPVVPCFIEGSPHGRSTLAFFFMRARVQIVIGPVIDMAEYRRRCDAGEDSKGLLDEITIRFLKEIAALANRPDFQPAVVGRNARPSRDEKPSVHT